MSFYLDTNILVSFIFRDAHSIKVEAWIAKTPRSLIIGAWTEVEFLALVRRWSRSGLLTVDQAENKIADASAFIAERAQQLPLSPTAGARAASLARDPLLKLSAADALHLACASEGGHCLVTNDARLIEAARARGFAVEAP